MSAADLLEALPGAALSTGRLLAVTLLPPALLGLALRSLERLMTARLASCLGRRWVLITGWLGVPVHELSHVLACWVFMHRVERVVLFDPDPAAPSLGRVEHSWSPCNPWAQIGRLVIGLAPLLGGSLALVALTWWLGPGVVLAPPADPAAGIVETLASQADDLARLARDWWRDPTPPDAGTAAWLFLCLCVGSHMAPSGADLKGSLRGLIFVSVATLVTLLLLPARASGDVDPATAIAPLVAPLVALLTVALGLVALLTALVWLLTWPVLRRGHTGG